jgi:hypothetical protein
MFRDNLSVPSSGGQVLKKGGFILDFRPLKMGPIGCPESSVRNLHYVLRNDPEERGSPVLVYYLDKNFVKSNIRVAILNLLLNMRTLKM